MSACGSLWQDCPEFEANLDYGIQGRHGYAAKSCLKTRKKGGGGAEGKEKREREKKE